jgi:hypothetical protein
MPNIDEKIYEEVGANYRFFLGWRHAAFAGYIVVVGAAISFTMSTLKDSPSLAFIIPLGTCPIGFLLWCIDVRNRSLYAAVNRAGARLEGPSGGSYTNLANSALPSSSIPILSGLMAPISVIKRWFPRLKKYCPCLEGQLSHSFALTALFNGGSIALLWLGLRLHNGGVDAPAQGHLTSIGIPAGQACRVHLRADILPLLVGTWSVLGRTNALVSGTLIAADSHGVQLKLPQGTNWIPASSILFIEHKP